jgi:betaine-aldehyde dehydrogenase
MADELLITTNPATGEKLAELPIAGLAEVEAAVTAARAAQPDWGAMPGAERARVLRRAAGILRERNDTLAELETRDTGKPIQETRVVDVISGAECLEYFAALAQSAAGEHIDLGPASRFLPSYSQMDSRLQTSLDPH